MILTVLCDNTAFADLSNQQRVDLIDAFVPVHIKRGDILFRQGDYGHYFYIVDDGECEVYVQKLSQPAMRVATVHKGASFGELALMYTGYRRATLVATRDTVRSVSSPWRRGCQPQP
jgi:cAMP-dependent protein kinase regulator